MKRIWKIVAAIATVIGLITDGLALYAFLTSKTISVDLPNLEVTVTISRDGLAVINIIIGIAVAFLFYISIYGRFPDYIGPYAGEMFEQGCSWGIFLFFVLFSCAIWGLIPGIKVRVPGRDDTILNSLEGQSLVNLAIVGIVVAIVGIFIFALFQVPGGLDEFFGIAGVLIAVLAIGGACWLSYKYVLIPTKPLIEKALEWFIQLIVDTFMWTIEQAPTPTPSR